MRVLITGAAGFLGRHFVRHHLEAGDEVLAVDDLSNASAPPFPFIQLDAAEAFRLEPGPFDWVYHFAAPVGGRTRIDGDPLFNADSLRLDSELFRAAARGLVTPDGVVVYPSSSAVYPVWAQTAENFYPLKEEMVDPAEVHWGAPDQMYGFTKLAGEYLAWKAAGYGVNTLCIRPFSGYGEGQSLDYPVPSLVYRALRGDDPIVVWGPGTQTRDFIHVEDLVRGTVARLESGVRGYRVLNLGSGMPTSFEQVAIMAADIVGYTPYILPQPDKPVGVMHRYCDPTEMLRYYTPRISLRDGLKRVLEDMDSAPDRE